MYTKIKKRLAIVLSAICAFAVAFGLYGILTNEIGAITSSAETYMETSTASDLSTSGAYKLTSDITASSAITISSGTSVIIDLNGHTLTITGSSTISDYASNSRACAIVNNGTLTIEDSAGGGIIEVSGDNAATYTIFCSSTGSLNISGGTIKGTRTIHTDSAVTITGGEVKASFIGVYLNNSARATISGDTKITVDGTNASNSWVYGVYLNAVCSVSITDSVNISAENSSSGGAAGIVYWGNNNESTPVTIVINGGTTYGSTYGISGNGSYSYSDVTITGGTIEGGVTGYFHPEMGTLTITDGSITGKYAGLQVCAGDITITGGTFTATATSDEINSSSDNTSNKTGDGSIADGAAISIINRKGYGISQDSSNNTTSSFSSNSVTITGGTFTSESNVESVQAYNYNSSISDGSKVSALETTDSNAQTIVAVTGGSFSSSLSGTYSSYVIPTGLATSTSEGTTTITLSSTATETYKESKVLLITASGITGCDSVSAAITAAKESSLTAITLYLNSDITECISIPAGLTVTLDLCGYTITNKVTTTETTTTSDHTITVASGATLTINDTSSESTGTVDNITHAKAALYNKGVTVLNGGTFTRSKEAGDKKTSDGGNSWYTIDNQGTLIINDGVTVTTRLVDDDENAVGTYSSLIRNLGSSSGAGGILTINGGTFIGGLNTVKNDESSTLTINGGTFTNTYQYVILNWNVATINDGTFIVSGSNTAVVCVGAEDDTTVGSITINGGTFVGTDLVITEYTKYAGYTTGTDVTINGGSFSGGAFSSGIESYSVTGGTYDSTAYNSLKSYIVNANINLVYDDSTGTYTATSYDVMLETSSGTEYFYDDDDSTALEQAISAMSTEGTYTITLGSDYTLSSALTIASGYDVTLDLNGYTLNVTGTAVAFNSNSTDYYAGVINNGTLTITDSANAGEFVINVTKYGIYNSGTLVINGGKIINNYSVETSSPWNDNGFVIYNKNSVTINGGTITGAGRGIVNYATLIVYDGSIISENGFSIVDFDGTVIINGGEISGYYAIYASGTSANVTIGEENGNDNNIIITGVSGRALEVQSGATAKIYSGTLSGYYGVTLWGYSSDAYSTLYVYGGTITATSFAICGNGTTGQGYDNIYIYGGTITSTDAAAIYNPQQEGITYIIGGTITGMSGIEVRNGTVYIGENYNTSDLYYEYAQSLVITATGNPLTAESNYSGSAISGAAIAVATYNLQDINLTVGEGTYISASGYAVYEEDVNNYASKDGGITKTLSVALTGGTYTGTVYSGTASTTNTTFVITGGTYSTNVSAYAAEGFTTSYDSTTGTYGIVVDTTSTTTNVAYLNGKGYASLQEAINNATDGTTAYITLCSNVNEDITVASNKNIILDLSGCIITNSTSTSTIILNGGALTITNGTVYNNTGSASTPAIYVYSGATLTLGNGAIVSGYVGIRNGNSTAKVGGVITVEDGATITGTYAGIMSYGDLTVNGGTITGGFGIVIYGMVSDDRTQIIINGGTITGTENAAISSYGYTGYGYVDLYIYDGTITGEGSAASAIYLPATDGATYIYGGTITGIASGVEIRAGSLTITDGTITATATTFSAEANGNGETVIGAAVAISQHTTNKDISVTISGGTFTGIYAVYEADLQDSSSSNISASLTGGTFEGSVYSQNVTSYISGGTYTVLPDTTYFATDYCAYHQADGTYTTISGKFATMPALTTTTYVYTGSSPDLSELEGAGYAVSIDGYIVGTHAVTLTLNSGYVWSDGTIANKTLYITITAADMVVSATNVSIIYSGSAVGLTAVSATTVDSSAATVTYTYNETTYSSLSDISLKDAGTYTIYYTVTADNHNEVTGSFTVTIEKATYNMSGVSLEDTTVTYNGSEQSIKITGTLPTGVTVSYSGSGTTVGTYTITATFTGDSDNYEAIASLTATLTITKATVTAPAEDSTTYTYNGKAQTYGIATNDLYTISGATQTNAGTYTVTVDLVDHDNYVFDSGKTMLTYTFTIAKATVDVPEASTKDYTYNGSEQTYDIAESSLYTINGATHTNAGTYTVTVALVDYDNYAWSDSTVTAHTYTFIIEKADNAISVSISGWIYGQSANAPVATVTGESGTIVYGYSTAIDGNYTATAPTAAGTYYVMVYIAATTNYNEAYSTPVAFTIAKATYDMSGVALADLTVTYDGTARSILISGTLPAGVTVTYTGNGNTEAGAYTITAAFAGDSANYEAIASLTATLTISKAAITATAEGYSGTYDGGAHSGSIATISGATIAYGTSEGTYDLAEAPAYTSAGTYTVYYQISKENYETLTGSYTVTITAATVEVSEDNTVVGTVTSDTLTVEVTANINLVEEESYDLATETIVETVVAAIEEVESAEVVAVYDITLTTAGGEGITVADATDSGKIAVTVAIPTALASKDFYIVHIHDGEIIGIITSDEYEKINGSVTFEVSSLSQFAFVETSTVTTTQSSNNFETYLMIGLVVGDLIAVLLIVVVACMVIRRKRTA